jgi:hypothetical protein
MYVGGVCRLLVREGRAGFARDRVTFSMQRYKGRSGRQVECRESWESRWRVGFRSASLFNGKKREGGGKGAYLHLQPGRRRKREIIKKGEKVGDKRRNLKMLVSRIDLESILCWRETSYAIRCFFFPALSRESVICDPVFFGGEDVNVICKEKEEGGGKGNM